MKILVVDALEMTEEVAEKLQGKDITFVENEELTDEVVDGYDVVFDFDIENNFENLAFYEANENLTVFLNTVKVQLAEIIFTYGKMNCSVFGFNGLPTFFNRQYLECALNNESDKEALAKICANLGTEFLVVQDRVGLVTPRVVLMIINEACYTLQEGTAGITDIDQGMKLGTNYPHGPFEWADMIGIEQVYETLEALYEDTKEERYKICPLLKTKYLKGERFYQIEEVA